MQGVTADGAGVEVMIELPSLYQHQEEHRDRTRAAIVKHGRVILNAPTGCGKTRMSKWILGASANREKGERQSGRSLFCVHRRGLVDNAIDSFAEEPAMPHGVIMSGRETQYGRRIQVASIDTLLNWFVDGGEYQSDITFDLIVWDEAHSHHPKFAKFLAKHDAKREQLELHRAFVIGLTATPQASGLADIYKEIVPGPPTQWLIDNGYLSPFRYFQATQGRLDKLVKRGGEFTKDSVCEAMDGLAGDLVRDWKQFADGRPTVGFFPRRSHAKDAMEKLTAAGLRVEYVDGETPDDERKSIFRCLNNKSIDYLCNVQVVERGTDIPRIGCVQLCVAIGSLARYRQIIGRGSRVHPEKTDCCVAKGTPILTDRGLVPIEDVTVADRVWDGKEWCFHRGPYCNGVKEVIEYSGLLLTPDHEVLTNDGWKTAETAKIGGWRPVVGGVSGSPVWTADDSNPHDPRKRCNARSGGGLFNLRQEGVAALPQDIAPGTARVRTLHGEIWAALPGMGMAESAASATAVSVPAKYGVSPLRRAWDTVSFLHNLRRRVLGCTTPRTSTEQIMDDRSNRQQRALRTWQSSMGNSDDTITQSGFCLACATEEEVSVCDVLGQEPNSFAPERIYTKADRRPLAVEVWDIANAGPRNRYCANGIIIANCILDHGGNVKRMAPYSFFEDDPHWTLDTTTKEPGEIAARPVIECPKCKAIYRGGRCKSCGYEPTPRERRSQGLEFDGRELKEVIRSEKKPNIKTAEELMISAIYQAGLSGRTWRQAVGIYKRMCEKQGTPHRVPRHVTVGGRRYEMIQFGSEDASRRVASLYPFTVGNGHGGEYLAEEVATSGKLF